MLNMIRTFIFLFIGLNASAALHAQGFRIDLEAPDFAESEVILVEYFTSRMIPKDTILLDDSGKGTFAADSLLDGGLYLIFFNQRNFFDFMIGDDQVMEIFTDSTDFVGKTRFRGSKNNSLFFEYKRFLSEKRTLINQYSDELANAQNASDSASAREQIENINQEMKAYAGKIISDHPDLFISTFLRSMKDVEIPDEILEQAGEKSDSARYAYYKDHYFDHFDITDIRLLHTPLYEPKIKNYINKVAIQHPDSLINTVDYLIEKSRAHPAIFRYMLITLFNNFAESKLMGMDKVYFHIAEKYYIDEAYWSSRDYIDKLKENLEKSRHTFINDPAPDFQLIGITSDHFHLAQMDTAIKRDPYVGFEFNVYDIVSDYTILYFWEADCGHCKKSTPELYKIFEEYKDHLTVLAVHVINSEEGKEKWVDFVNEHAIYDWVNCWSPFSNDFRKLYNLNSFPKLFLLDKEKILIAKDIAPEQAGQILERLIND